MNYQNFQNQLILYFKNKSKKSIQDTAGYIGDLLRDLFKQSKTDILQGRPIYGNYEILRNKLRTIFNTLQNGSIGDTKTYLTLQLSMGLSQFWSNVVLNYTTFPLPKLPNQTYVSVVQNKIIFPGKTTVVTEIGSEHLLAKHIRTIVQTHNQSITGTCMLNKIIVVGAVATPMVQILPWKGIF